VSTSQMYAYRIIVNVKNVEVKIIQIRGLVTTEKRSDVSVHCDALVCTVQQLRHAVNANKDHFIDLFSDNALHCCRPSSSWISDVLRSLLCCLL